MDLVDDILSVIFASDALSPRDKVNIALASRRFYDLVVDELPTEIVWTNWRSIRLTMEAWQNTYAQHAHRTRRLMIDVSTIGDYPYLLSDNPAPAFLSKLTGLHDIKVITNHLWFSDKTWRTVVAAVPSLQTLSLEIKEFGGRNTFYRVDSDYKEFLQGCNDLKILNVSIRQNVKCPNELQMSVRTDVAILSSIPSLRHISYIMKQNTLKESLLDLYQLRHLTRVEITTNLTDRTIYICDHLYELNPRISLRLRFVTFPHKDEEEGIIKKCNHGKCCRFYDNSLNEYFESGECTYEIEGPVGLAKSVLQKFDWIDSDLHLRHHQCGVKIYQRSPSSMVHVTCGDILGLQTINGVRSYANIESLHICEMDFELDTLLGICEKFAGLKELYVGEVSNEEALNYLFFPIFGSDILPKFQNIHTMHIPLQSYVGNEQEMKDYLYGWSRFCPNLRNVVLVPGTKWKRVVGSNRWITEAV